MSTKIYTGLCLDAGSASANLRLLDDVIRPVQALVDLKNRKLVTEAAVHLLDRLMVRARLGELLTPQMVDMLRGSGGVLLRVISDTTAQQTRCRRGAERAPRIDCDVSVFLRHHHESGAMLAYIQEERVGVRDWLLGQQSVRDYAYWNNTDRPQEISSEEWDTRARHWRTVLTNNTACLTLAWEPVYPAISDEDLRFIPGHLARAQELARGRLLDEAVHALMTEDEVLALKSRACFAGLSRALRKAEGLLSNPDTVWGSRFVTLTQEIAAMILPTVTMTSLLSSPRDLPELSGLPWETLTKA